MVCLAVLLAGCGLNLVKKAQVPTVKKEPVVNNVATSSEKIATSTTESVVEKQEDTNLNPDNWKTYSDSVHGFELKIPQEVVYVSTYTLDEVKNIYIKQEEERLAEIKKYGQAGMGSEYLFQEMNDGRIKNDVDAWVLGKEIYDGKNTYKEDQSNERCRKDKTIFNSCFVLSPEGDAVFYKKIAYHKNSRISIAIEIPHDRYNEIKGDGKIFLNGESVLLGLYINNSFTEKEKKYVDAMDEMVASFKFTK